MFFSVNKELCKRDSICSMLCPASIIKVDEETKYPYVRERDERKCIKCGQCISFCPHFACDVATVTESYVLEREKFPSSDAADALLMSRRSIRMFRKKGLERETIESLIRVANNAPTAENHRDVRWVVFLERKDLDRAVELILEYWEPFTKEMPIIRGLSKYVRAGKDIIFRGAPQLVTVVMPKEHEWHEDGVIALTYLEIAAHAHGAGMCWAGFMVEAARHYKPLREHLGMTEEEYVCGAQMIGRPSFGLPKKIPVKTAAKISFI